MMPISRSPETRRQTGATLIELLAVLAIVALGASLSAAAVGAVLPGVKLASAAADFEGALKDARTTARTTGRPIVVEATPDGYAVGDRLVAWPRGVSAEWATDTDQRIVFRANGFVAGAEVSLRAGDRTRIIHVAPLTGRIHVEG